jgi:hypothetical protein
MQRIAVVLLLLAGCASGSYVRTPVFGDAELFRVDTNNRDVLLFQNPAMKVTSYSKFLIDPVKIYSNDLHGISQQDQSQLAEGFRTELINVLQDAYPIVNEAGIGVMRIRIGIENIQPAHLETDENKFLVIRLDTLLARVSMQLDCLDSITGERIATLIDKLHDRRYFEKEKKTRFLNIQDAFRLWTGSLRKRFDAAKTRPDSGFYDPEIDQGNKRLKFEEGD